jgi:hypothetical protein
LADVAEVLLPPSLIALMMEAVRTSETSVNFYETTRRNKAHQTLCSGQHFDFHSALVITFVRNHCDMAVVVDYI